VSFVAAGLGVSLVPAAVRHMTVHGAVYRPLAQDETRVELAAAWRRDDDRPVLARALDVIRRDLGAARRSPHVRIARSPPAKRRLSSARGF
jgi:DNA-binding transcriptional LysR family regulator